LRPQTGVNVKQEFFIKAVTFNYYIPLHKKKFMKRIIVMLVCFCVVATLHAQKFIVNDANAQVRLVGSFTAIQVSSAIDIYLSQGDEDAVAVSAKENKYRDNIKTEVKNGVLKIWYDNKDGLWGKGDKKMKVYISARTLNEIVASGASDVYINGRFKVEVMNLKFSGASDFKGEIEAKKLVVDISGASDVDIKGSVAQLDVQASGASDLKGYDLQTDICNAAASGASGVKITVNKELTVKASGASDVYYKGSGVIKGVQSSGASSVSKKG
jgi:Putative auto-transporter adhesin, head GIN domain